MNRRQLIASAPAVLAVGAVPAVAGETEIEMLFAEWQRLFKIEKAVYNASPTGGDDDTKAATDSLLAVENAIIEIPAKSARDWMLKSIAVSCFGVFPVESEDHPLWSEARALIAA